MPVRGAFCHAFAAIACIAAVALIVIYIPMLRRPAIMPLSDSPAPESGTSSGIGYRLHICQLKGAGGSDKALHEQHYDGSKEIIVVSDGEEDNGVEDFLTTV